MHGEYILYESSADLHPCAGTARYTDNAVPFLAEQLDVTIPPSIRFSWLAADDIPTGTRVEGSRYVSGSVLGSHAWADDPVSIHEIVHLISGGRAAPPFFLEGVAVMMDILDSQGGGPRYLKSIDFDPRETMDAKLSSGVDYSAAGLFVTYLFVRHGPERFRNFFRSMAWPCTMSQIRESFRDAFGVDLDAEVEDFMHGSPLCATDYFDLKLTECSGSVLAPSQSGTWIYAETMDCEATEVIGGVGRGHVWPSFRAVTVEIPETGDYTLSIHADDFAWLRFGPCFGCPWDDKDVILLDEEPRNLQLTAGTHYLRVNSDSDLSPTFEIRLQKTDL